MKKYSSFFRAPVLVLTVLCVLLFVTSYSLMHWMILVPNSDLNIHALQADGIAFSPIHTWFQKIAHPFWHFSVLFFRMIGVPFSHAGVFVTAVTKVLHLIMISWFYHRMLKGTVRDVWIPVLAFITVIVAAIRIPSINPNVYINAGTPNPWHSPTQLMVMFWMMPCVYFLTSSYDRQLQSGSGCTLSWKQELLFSTLLLASVVSKPVFVQCFFPGAAIYFLFQWIRHPQYTRFYIRLLLSLIPTILFMLLQLNSYFGPESNSGFCFVFDAKQITDSLIAALLTNAFPIFVLTFTDKKQYGSARPIVVLTALAAFAENCFLGETGIRAQHGNWGWAILAASWLLWIISVPPYVKMLRQEQTVRTLLFSIPSSLLLTWHFCSGVYYLYYLFTSGIWY